MAMLTLKYTLTSRVLLLVRSLADIFDNSDLRNIMPALGISFGNDRQYDTCNFCARLVQVSFVNSNPLSGSLSDIKYFCNSSTPITRAISRRREISFSESALQLPTSALNSFAHLRISLKRTPLTCFSVADLLVRILSHRSYCDEGPRISLR